MVSRQLAWSSSSDENAGNQQVDENTMHPERLLPAISSALESTRRSMSSFGGGQLLLNPRVGTPGRDPLPEDGTTFAFWRINDPETLEFFLQQLCCHFDMLQLENAEWDAFPDGYGLVRFVLRFEMHCQFSSWLALENVGPDDLQYIRRYYRLVGLAQEAEALERAERAWYQANGHAGDGYDAAGKAYGEVEHAYRDEDERLDYLVERVRDEGLWRAI